MAGQQGQPKYGFGCYLYAKPGIYKYVRHIVVHSFIEYHLPHGCTGSMFLITHKDNKKPQKMKNPVISLSHDVSLKQ